MYSFQGKCTCCVGRSNAYADSVFDNMEHLDTCQAFYPFSFVLEIFVTIISS